MVEQAERPGMTLPRWRGSVAVHIREASYFLAIGIIYLLIANFAAGGPPEADRNAFDIVELQRDIGVWVEPSWQAKILPHDWLIDVSNLVYFWGHAPVLAVAFVLVYVFRSRSGTVSRAYSMFRTGFIVAELAGMTLYILYPVTPPRLLPAEYGVMDTLRLGAAVNYSGESAKFLVNAYAAFPSLHVAWVILVSAVLSRCSLRFLPLAILLPFLSVSSVVVTGNHYLTDAAGGVGMAALGLLVAVLLPDERIRRTIDRLRGRQAVSGGSLR